MITLTTFKVLIYVVYIWFVLGAGLISVFAVKELWTMLTEGSRKKDYDKVVEGKIL